MEASMVRLEDLCKRFGKIVAVDGVNLDIGDGEFVTLLGPSGCGKTTTLRMIAGLETPTSGSIYLANQDVTGTAPEKRPVNMVFQAYALFPHLTIGENIAFGPRIKKWPREKIQQGVEEMLQLVQLEGYENRRPGQLSGGQAQRVALARALINQPKVLLLDEPLGALDLKLRQAMQIELRSLQQRLGMTFVYVTHDQQEAMVMSDRIVLMNEGGIIQIGTPAEVYNHPASDFVSQFIGETNLIEGVVETAGEDHLEIVANGLKLIVPNDKDFVEGQRVAVSVRPERIHLFESMDDAPDEWEDVLIGEVETVFFLGPTSRYYVRVNDEHVLIVDKASTDHRLKWRVGETVYVGWEKASNVVFSL
jgi:spermidine/putrescine ABC transporter ATP-binding subunit